MNNEMEFKSQQYSDAFQNIREGQMQLTSSYQYQECHFFQFCPQSPATGYSY